MTLVAPFPWFGGKRAVASDVWRRFGDCPNYVEPFAGSLAVLLARPHKPKTETVNDKDGFVANFWRAVRAAPAEVARHADYPVSEADLEARHYWLVTEGAARLRPLLGNPLGFDAEVAGWWLWGACSWIASGWCSGEGPWWWNPATPGWASAGSSRELGDAGMGVNRQLPHLGDAGRGVNRKLPHLGSAGMGVNRQLPHLGDAGMGVNRKLPHLGAGRGVNRKLPHLGSAGRGEAILAWMERLAVRLRDVRIAYGDWSRVTGPSVTFKHGITAVFLDPPYGEDADRTSGVYATDCDRVAREAAAWSAENGDNPELRIALCGYAGEHELPVGWTAHRWKARGGYGSQGEGRGRENSARETIWFSPHCLRAGRPHQASLFAEVAAA